MGQFELAMSSAKAVLGIKKARDSARLTGVGKGKPDSDFDADSLAQGVKVEMEHTDNSEIAKTIAKDHLTEDPDYYKKLAKMEKKVKQASLNIRFANLKLKLGAEFKENEHPRDSDGQFTCKTCGQEVSNNDKESHEAGHAVDKVKQKDQQLKKEYETVGDEFSELSDKVNQKIKDGYQPKTKLDMRGWRYDDYLRSTFSGYNIVPFSDNPQLVKEFWEEMAESDPEIKKGWEKMKSRVKEFNEKTVSEFESSPTFFRGVSRWEIDDYLQTNQIGSEDTGLKYKFTSVTPSLEAAKVYEAGVIVEYDGDDIRKLGDPVQYDLFWRKFGENYETQKDGQMAAYYMDQLEVRIPRKIPLDKLKIKTIYIDLETAEKVDLSKYRKLGKVVVGDFE